MAVDRIWHWRCDGCGASVERNDYGFPSGWIFVKAAVITHRCPECVESISKDQRGYPKVTAEK